MKIEKYIIIKQDKIYIQEVILINFNHEDSKTRRFTKVNCKIAISFLTTYS